MKLLRGLDGEQKGTHYSIENIRFSPDVVEYSVPADKTWHRKYVPRVVIDLKGSPESGGFEHHSAVLVIKADELRKLADALEEHLLDGFHILVEHERQAAETANDEPPEVAAAT